MKVMIVDDSTSMRLIVKRTLKQAGYDMDYLEADDGSVALEKIDDYNPCLLYTSPSPRDKRQSRMPSSA